MSADRRALHSPFSSPPVDAPLSAEGRDRLLPVERALQAPAPAEDDQEQDTAPVTGRRHLGPGGAAIPADDAAR